MKYLCLVYFEGATLDALTPEEHVELDRDSLDYNKELQRRGHLVHAEALQSLSQAITVRVRNQHRWSLRRDQVQVAAQIPLAKLGSIEVRPIYEIPVPPPRTAPPGV